jgi:hypothetical protein
MKKTTVAALVLFAVSACAVSKVDPLTVPLSYTPDQKNANTLGAVSCPVISEVQVQNALTTGNVLGVRTHESKPLTAEVTTNSDIAAWVQSGVQGFLMQNGFSLNPSAPTLVIRLDTLHSTETIWHRSSIDAQLAITGSLSTKSGKTCGGQRVDGEGGDYGYAGSIQNYQNSFNAALNKAAGNLLRAAGFQQGLCDCAK